MNENKNRIRKITGMAILLSIVAILQFLAGYLKIGPVEINFGLIPIVIGAILYGPIEGMLLGIMNGLLVIVNPGTAAFMAVNPVATIFVCILKTGLAGLFSGLLYKLISKKNDLVASIIASLVVPVTNTGIFFIGCLLFWIPLFGETTQEAIATIATVIFAVNTLIEIISISILSPAIYRIILIVKKVVFKTNSSTNEGK